MEAKFSNQAEAGSWEGAAANFSRATFSGEANFSRAKFSNQAEADFFGAQFEKEANFSNAIFYGRANFSSGFGAEAKFLGAAQFSGSSFQSEVDFSETKFSDNANFSEAKFSGQAHFSSIFNAKTFFNNVLFEDGKKILFNTEDLSKVSFANTDITHVRFIETARWGKGKKDKDRFKIIEERNLEESPENVKNLGSIMAVYRNLRENYEFRLRYDEAGKFFIKEMELKRNYREEDTLGKDNGNGGSSSSNGNSNSKIVRNDWPRRNLSLTGLYYHLSRYGENLLRPTVIGIFIIFGSTLFWLMQSNPYAEPSLSHVTGFAQVVANHTQWQKAFERSFADFLPLLPLGSKIQVGLSDYVIKILGGALTFGFIAIALRRKFERKYTR
jgi:hypothetical protein